MLEKNIGKGERILRFSVAVSLISVGLFVLDGWHRNPIGIVVAAFALMPLTTSLTGYCFLYKRRGISKVSGKVANLSTNR